MKKVKLLVDDLDLYGKEVYVDFELKTDLIVHFHSPLDSFRVAKNEVEWLPENELF